MFHTELCELLDIRYPIIQGALGGARPVSDATLVAAVSNAGGFGILSTWMTPPREILSEIERVRSLTERPFGVNIAAHSSSFDFKKRAKLLAEAGIPAVTTGRGDPKIPTVSLLKEHGIKVLPVVPTVRHALRLEAEGADAIIASGCEAGGHVGEITTLSLIPQVVDAVKVPVIAAGGIADARGFVSALALGACGVQIGSRFVASSESIAPDILKEKILQASAEDTVVTTMRTGWTVRCIKSRFTEEWAKLIKKGASSEELGNFRRDVTGKIKERIEEDTIGAGQVCGLINDIKSTEEIIDEIIEGAKRICFRLAGEDMVSA
jgi:enoyl-[acyl-carrier protein] reductase II